MERLLDVAPAEVARDPVVVGLARLEILRMSSRPNPKHPSPRCGSIVSASAYDHALTSTNGSPGSSRSIRLAHTGGSSCASAAAPFISLDTA